MNSLVFNTTASELKTSNYAFQESTASLQLLQLDDEGNLLVSVANANLNVEISNTGLSVEITNTSLTVDIINTLLTVDIINTLLTVDIANTSLTVAVSNESITVLIAGNSFTAIDDLGTGTSGTILEFDTSLLKTATIFIDNSQGPAFTLSLMLSPDNEAFFPSPNYKEKRVAENSVTVMAVDIFAHYIALSYVSDVSASFDAYLNAQA